MPVNFSNKSSSTVLATSASANDSMFSSPSSIALIASLLSNSEFSSSPYFLISAFLRFFLAFLYDFSNSNISSTLFIFVDSICLNSLTSNL